MAPEIRQAALRTRQVTIESGRAAKAARRLRLSAAVRAIVSFRVLSKVRSAATSQLASLQLQPIRQQLARRWAPFQYCHASRESQAEAADSELAPRRAGSSHCS